MMALRMAEAPRVLVLDRRDFVLGAGASALLAGLLAAVPEAQAVERSAEFEAAIKALLGAATPKAGGIVDLPA
jgi:hypothetical protein